MKESSNKIGAPGNDSEPKLMLRAIAGFERRETAVRSEMARLEGETSNALFETLEGWNTYLKAENIELPKPEKRHGAPVRRGPSP